MKKLYELVIKKEIRKNDKIYYETIEGEEGYAYFQHLDGIYSLSITKNSESLLLRISTPLKKYKDGWIVGQ